MKYFKQVFLFTLFASCARMSDLSPIRFKYYQGVKNHNITMQVPKKYKLIKIHTGGEGEEHRFWYSDSSLIYISDADGSTSVNEHLIRQQEVSSSKYILLDSIVFKGVNDKGNYWQETKYKGLHFGYSNVSPDKKKLFDNAILSAKHN